MIGLIDSAVASIALAPPMRPPFFRFSSVSRAPHSLVARRQRAGVGGDLVVVGARGGQAGAGGDDHPLGRATRCGCRRPSPGTPSNERAPSSALCIVADSAADRHTATIDVGAVVGQRRVGVGELAGAGAAVDGSRRRRRALRPELGRGEVAAVDVVVAVDADGQRHDGDAELVGDG